MWRKIISLFGRKTRRRPEPADTASAVNLDDATRKEALEHARLLFSQGVWVQHIRPGEIPDETPESAETIH